MTTDEIVVGGVYTKAKQCETLTVVVEEIDGDAVYTRRQDEAFEPGRRGTWRLSVFATWFDRRLS